MDSQVVRKTKVVVIGNGMVGHHFVEQLVELSKKEQVIEITVLSAESRLLTTVCTSLNTSQVSLRPI